MNVIIDGIEYIPKAEEHKSGENCPRCGFALYYKVVDSRIKDSIRIRRKRCLHCSCEWKTAEYMI